MLIKVDEIKEFVCSQVLSGEELFYVSSITRPRIEWQKIFSGLFVLVLLCVAAFFIPQLKPYISKDYLGVALGVVILSGMLWSLLFYKRSTRRIVAVTGLRFLIFEYSKDLHRMKAEDLEDFENLREITFDAVEMMKLTRGKDNSGVLAMVFEEEDESKKGYVQASLNLEIEDCDAIKRAIPARLRPDGSKEDFWERSYGD